MTNTNYAKKLIINADDFGWDEDTYKATIDCMEAGSITSATIMTGRPATDLACQYAAKNAHRFSFGLHFNIVDQHKPLSADPVSLTDRDTFNFRQSGRQRLHALLWRLNYNQLQNELIAQLNLVKKSGVKITHIDSHGHLHKFPNVILALKPILYQHGISRVRRPQNLYGKGIKISTKLINKIATPFFSSLTLTNHFLTIASYEDNWFNQLLTLLPNGTTELAVHPGYMENWRHKEIQPLLDKNFSTLIMHNGTELTNYNNYYP